MDGNGIPLAFDITPGNTNEQKTLQPLEQKIIKDLNFLNSLYVLMQDLLQKLIENLIIKIIENL